MSELKAPFPGFGGKSKVASLVWQRLGDVKNFIEPFVFTAAVALRRPHPPRIETINDIDCYVTNFWRAVKHDKSAVVDHLDYPVIEADLHARHRWLVLSDDAAAFRERMKTDPDYYDAKIAGWWCWGACMWIGGGWCSWSNGPERRPALSFSGGGTGINGAQRLKEPKPQTDGDQIGRGVHSKRNALANERGVLSRQVTDISGDSGAAGRGVHTSGGRSRGVTAEHAQRPDLKGEGVAVHGRRHPDLAGGRIQLADEFGPGRGVHANGAAGTCAERREWLEGWLGDLSDRLRLVRVCNGHWLRVCSSRSVTTRIGMTGVFLDPPYPKDLGRFHAWLRHLRDGEPLEFPESTQRNRDGNLYAADADQDVDRLAAEVHCWCIEKLGEKDNFVRRCDHPKMRIALCGYEGEHDELDDYGFEVESWEAHGGYANRGGGNDNRTRERIWFSRNCLKEESLFSAGTLQEPAS